MVKSADRVMKILSLVGESKHGLKHLEISERLSIPKGSLSLLLADLVAGEFLVLTPVDKRFRIGPKILVLAGRYLADMDIVDLSQPIVRKVINETGESCGVGVRKGNHVIIVWRENSDEALKWDLKIGDEYLMHGSAFGKAILAFTDPDGVNRYIKDTGLSAITEFTITSADRLEQELSAIRAGAMAYSREESFKGMISIGVPVFDHTGQIAASMSVPIPASRFGPEKEKKVCDALKSAATQLSRDLGYRGR